jgi:aspartyl-tRNA(Asn)/glutamyl-tRNA(Gln) amidotransferase subunit A
VAASQEDTMSQALTDLTIAQMAAGLDRGEYTSRQLTEAALARINALEPKINAFITRLEADALAQADAADQRRAAGEKGALLGVPLAIKDNLCTTGVLTTCASKILDNFKPPFDATVITKLRKAGAVFVGKTNLDEFAMGSSTENSAFKKTVNPWDFSRIPGGSSGGSAAAVAARFCPGSLGSDTGGSIRQPAALCGVVGLKPTYGRVSRYGLVAFASSLDQIGPFARTVEDTAILLGAIAGHDPMDSTSAPNAVPDYLAALAGGAGALKGLRVGLPREYFVDGMDPEIEAGVRAAVQQMAALGAEVIDITLPHTAYAIAVYYLCATAEASSNLARYDGCQYGHRAPHTSNIIEMFTRTRTEGFGTEVKRRIMLGTYALSAGFYDAYYLKALKVRTLIKRDFEQAFEKCDIIATPTTPTPAFKFGEKTDDPLQMYLSDIFTISTNLAGIPGLSMPCGLTGGGLPIGLQLLGPAFGEEKLLAAAHAYEQSQTWYQQGPALN